MTTWKKCIECGEEFRSQSVKMCKNCADRNYNKIRREKNKKSKVIKEKK